MTDTIINNSNPQESVIDYFPGDDLLSPLQRRRGLPIGNLSSQFFANVYLDSLDHFVKEKVRAKNYLRYVDDFALFSDDYGFLAEARLAIEEHLNSLRLKLHPVKSQLFETRIGASFLGFRVLPETIRVRSENLRRGQRRLKQLQRDYGQGKIEFQDVHNSIQSWVAHIAYGDTWRLRQKIFASLVFTRG